MKKFIARSPKQLDICLRMLYAENVSFAVKVVENEKRKIEYEINVNSDEQTYEILREKYRIMIS